MAANLVIYSVLSNNAGVAALVSNRIYPNIAVPLSALPYIVYDQIAANRYQAADGNTGLNQTTYSIKCYTATRGSATVLADAVRTALDHLPSTTVSGQTVLVTTCLGTDEDVQYRIVNGKQEPVYSTDLDFDVFVREA